MLRVLHACLAVALCCGAWPVNAEARPQAWVVRTGDTLTKIAGRFRVSAGDLRRWNGLRGDLIRPGQRLIVGTPGEARAQYHPARAVVVERGDTLGGLARRHGVRVEDILQHNPGVERDRVRAGATLRLPGHYLVRKGETLSRIAGRIHCSVDELHDWNPDTEPKRLRPGSRLVLLPCEEHHAVRAVSPRGRSNQGRQRLVNGVRVAPHDAYVVRNFGRAWGTPFAVRALERGLIQVRRRSPKAPRVRVHDLSQRRGGPIPGHSSHQDGRDVDLTYYQRSCGSGGCPLRSVSPSQLDVKHQWLLFRYWLSRGDALFIFMDHRLQKRLYEYARSHGASRQQLLRWFQYPRPPRARVGVIRHAPNHHHHVHVRFRH